MKASSGLSSSIPWPPSSSGRVQNSDTFAVTNSSQIVAIATPASSGALIRGVFWVLLGLLFAAAPAYGIFQDPELRNSNTAEVFESFTREFQAEPVALVGGIAVALIAYSLLVWPTLALGIHRFWAAGVKDTYLRGDQYGLKLRLPGGYTWWGALLRFPMLEIEIPWTDLLEATSMRILPSFVENYVVLKLRLSPTYREVTRNSRDDFGFLALNRQPPKFDIYLYGFLFSEGSAEIAARINELAKNCGRPTRE